MMTLQLGHIWTFSFLEARYRGKRALEMGLNWLMDYGQPNPANSMDEKPMHVLCHVTDGKAGEM
jgi:hypothetical protein